jgi:type III pantothenate kinase
VAAEHLLIDLGNSRLKWALFDGTGLGAVHALWHRERSLTDLLEPAWQHIAPARVIACSVAGRQRDEQLRDWVATRWSLAIDFFSSEDAYPGMRSGYADPAHLGNDRWLGCIAGFQRCRGNVGIIDAGSAITIDWVDANGQHQGGWILPGLQTMGHCLLQRTAIPDTDFRFDGLAAGKDTPSCIGQGALLACLGALNLAMAQTPPDTCWLLTGGDAATISRHLQPAHQVIDHLLLEGLALISHDETSTP